MSPPLTPDADDARRQLADELSKPIYSDPLGWLRDMWDRLLSWLSGADTPSEGLSNGQIGAIVLVAVVLVAVIVWSTLGPGQRRRGRKNGALFVDDQRSAEEVRAEALGLAADGEWTAATLALFRAMIRTLAEHDVIEEFGGMTAHEATAQACERLPVHAERLDQAAAVFDSLAYGRREAGPAQFEQMQMLDSEVRTAAPVPVAAAEAPSAVVVESAS